jgi:hypothetical protein
LLWDFTTALLAWILGVAAWPKGILPYQSYQKICLDRRLVDLHLNGSNFIDWLAVLFVFLFVDILTPLALSRVLECEQATLVQMVNCLVLIEH